MKGNTKLIAVIILCIMLLSAVGISFANGAFHNKAKEPVLTASNSPQNHNSSTATEPSTSVPGSESTVTTPKPDEMLPVSQINDKILEEIPAYEKDKYEFTTYAKASNCTVIAGCDKNDDTIGIIFTIKDTPDSLNKEKQSYQFPEKGLITLDSLEANKSIVTFSYGKGSQGYFDIESSNAVFENYYVKLLRQNPYFNPNVYEFKELKESSVEISKASAIKKALSAGVAGSQTRDAEKNFSAVLVKYTNKESPQLPGSKVVLKNYPVWIVTIPGVSIQKHGGSKQDDPANETPETFLADVHVFIDANSGAWLTTISHTSQVK